MISRHSRDLKRSKTTLQVGFRNIFCTVLNYFEPCVSLVTPELPENLKIRPRPTHKFSTIDRKRYSLWWRQASSSFFVTSSAKCSHWRVILEIWWTDRLLISCLNSLKLFHIRYTRSERMLIGKKWTKSIQGALPLMIPTRAAALDLLCFFLSGAPPLHPAGGQAPWTPLGARALICYFWLINFR